MNPLKTILLILAVFSTVLGDEVAPQPIPGAGSEAPAAIRAPEKVGEIVLAVLSDGTMRIERSSGDYNKLLKVTEADRENSTADKDRADRELSVSAPSAENGKNPEPQLGEIIINILADGTIKAEDRVIGLKDLQAKLEAIAAQEKNQPVRIRGDGGVAYQRIVEVIDTCQKAGIWNISFATQKPAPNR